MNKDKLSGSHSQMLRSTVMQKGIEIRKEISEGKYKIPEPPIPPSSTKAYKEYEQKKISEFHEDINNDIC